MSSIVLYVSEFKVPVIIDRDEEVPGEEGGHAEHVEHQPHAPHLVLGDRHPRARGPLV